MTFFLLQLFGTFVFALTGVISAGRKQLDLVGVLFISFVVANVGGTLRDLMLGAVPVFWIGEPVYLLVAVGTGLAFFVVLEYCTPPTGLLTLADALGLAVFAVAGADKTLTLGFSPLIAVIMGMITGVGGGLVRDLLCGDIPVIFRRELYATAALMGAAAYTGLRLWGMANWLASLGGVGLVMAVRLASLRYDINLPVFTAKRVTERWPRED